MIHLRLLTLRILRLASMVALVLILTGQSALASASSGSTHLAASPPSGQAGASLTWNQVPAMPTARSSAGFVYDSATRADFLFGGVGQDGVSSGEGPNQDTWTLTGSTWSRPSPATNPPATLDSALNEVVLFGGYDQNSNDGDADIWVWTGTNWVQQFSQTSPSARGGMAMAYDSTHGQVVLFGGNSSSLGIGSWNDTWTWDGTTWTQQFPASNPAPATSPTITYDRAIGLAVLYDGGNQSQTFPAVGQTWEWSGTNWTQLQPAASPWALFFEAMTYDQARGQVVIFGGQNYAFNDEDDTWVLSP